MTDYRSSDQDNPVSDKGGVTGHSPRREGGTLEDIFSDETVLQEDSSDETDLPDDTGRKKMKKDPGEDQDRQPKEQEAPEGSGPDETEQEYRRKKTEKDENAGKSKGKEILSWVKVIIIAIVIAFAIDFFIIANASVPSGSMEDTIPTSARIIGLRLDYLFEDPKRGDIVIFKYPDDESTDYVKRIIGLPGETVEIKDGKVYINGSDTPLDEPYVKGTPTGDFGPYHVPEDCYFMMGDNREDSWDSRYWDNTYVQRSKIVAKVYFMYFPKFKKLTYSYDEE